MNTNNKQYRYRATCTCGYKGKWFINPNDAVAAEENHAIKYDTHQGGRSDGRKHHTNLQEMQK